RISLQAFNASSSLFAPAQDVLTETTVITPVCTKEPNQNRVLDVFLTIIYCRSLKIIFIRQLF
ncbi:MAG TPA: hypothetical protein VEX65_09645, partial [Flavisolibacter sp.]|nr:hypothetical protein [Flavisolibacter sp.]